MGRWKRWSKERKGNESGMSVRFPRCIFPRDDVLCESVDASCLLDIRFSFLPYNFSSVQISSHFIPPICRLFFWLFSRSFFSRFRLRRLSVQHFFYIFLSRIVWRSIYKFPIHACDVALNGGDAESDENWETFLLCSNHPTDSTRSTSTDRPPTTTALRGASRKIHTISSSILTLSALFFFFLHSTEPRKRNWKKKK